MMEDEKQEDFPTRSLTRWNGRRRLESRRFRTSLSTEETHKIDDDQEPIYVGAFGHIRKLFVDHVSYHEHYRKERQWLHDSIIEDAVNGDHGSRSVSHGDDQWLVLTVGVQGCGKRYTMQRLMEKHGLQFDDLCFIDSDEIRQLLPEFDAYVETEPEVADSLMEKESGYISETMCWAALQKGQSVLWDSSLRYPEWFVDHIRKAKKLFPHLKIAAIHVTTPSPETIMERRDFKSIITGRRLYGDEAHVKAEMDRIAKNFEILRSEADVVATICNTCDELELVDDTLENFLTPFTEKQGTKGLAPLLENEKAPDEDGSPLGRSRSMTRCSMLLSSRSSCSNLSSRRRFNVLRSTEENHKSDDMNFYGRFAHIRASLDYSYHSNYTFKRQRLQDSIMQEFLHGAMVVDKDGFVCTTPQEPWIVFTAGPMGAGKSFTMHQLVERGLFPLLAFVNVDPDEIRRHFPEYQIYVEHAPEQAGELTRKEAGYLAEILTLAALEAGKNVLLDGSLRDSDWYSQYFGRLRTEFPVLRLSILQVTAPKECVIARAKARGEKTGRVVPEKLLLDVYEQVPRSVNKLKHLVDYHVCIDNPSDPDHFAIKTEGETWESFQSNWVQTCAWVPKSQRQNPKQISNGIGN